MKGSKRPPPAVSVPAPGSTRNDPLRHHTNDDATPLPRMPIRPPEGPEDHGSGPLRRWLSTIPALFLLLFAVAQGTSEVMSSRLLGLGEQLWPGYAELRYDPAPPTCDPAKLQAEIDRTPEVVPGPPKPATDDGSDLLSDAPEAAAAATVDDGSDLLSDAPPAPKAGAADDGSDLLADDPANAPRGPSRAAIVAAKAECEAQILRHQQLAEMVTPVLRVWRGAETRFAEFTESGRVSMRPLLVLLLLLCAGTASATGSHISLRSPTHRLDQRLSDGLQLVLHTFTAYSAWAYYQVTLASGVSFEQPWMPLLWMGGFLGVAMVNLQRLLVPPDGVEPGGAPLHAALAVPLHVNLGLTAAAWFVLGEQFMSGQPYIAGLAIYLSKLTEQAGIYMAVGLYVWAGMLLKQTLVANRTFDLLRPWNLPPEVLASIVVVLASFPVAYSGASGIFVIAAGGTIYDELRRAGARNQMALAATAMSGSLGVVLSPCLLVVVVAALNKNVTTGELFDVGGSVFVLTSALFVGVMLARRRGEWRKPDFNLAQLATTRAVNSLLPYFVVAVGVVLFYGVLLDTWIDDHSAPVILLAMLLFVLLTEAHTGPVKERKPVLPRLAASSNEMTVHIGALLSLMAFSVAFGAIIERSEVMALVPQNLGGPVPAMVILTFALIIIGMLMDPYGAVILVSASLAHVAENNGIHPVHFWMTVLVAFELGYLTPPVALNQLLTSSVVGRRAEEDDEALDPDASFVDRHERYVLPVGVMGTALLIVAFGPLFLT